jgi:hypothetical protein
MISAFNPWRLNEFLILHRSALLGAAFRLGRFAQRSCLGVSRSFDIRIVWEEARTLLGELVASCLKSHHHAQRSFWGSQGVRCIDGRL